MIQPKYDPKEALEKIKLNMKYDTSKTLNENRQLLNEFWPVFLAVLGGAGAIGGIATWISNVTSGGDSIEKTKRLFEGCSTYFKGLKQTLDDAKIKAIAKDIYDGVSEKTAGIFYSTDEEKVKNALGSLPTIADICAVKIEYEARYGENLFDDLDSDFDGEEFRKYVWIPMMDVVEKNNQELQKVEKEEDKKEEDKTDDGKKKTGGGGYTPCTGTYNFGCQSNAIAKVQSCLGIVADGKFGPKTKSALSAKGFTSFTDSDVDKICNKTVEVDTDIEDVDAEDPNQL